MLNSNVVKGTVKWFNETKVLVLFNKNLVQMFLRTSVKLPTQVLKPYSKANRLNLVLLKVKKDQMRSILLLYKH